MEKQILTTNDYSKFKRLSGNREVNPLRVKRIISSMVNVGYITNPIIVNEKYEIIDGQGRFEALKALNFPVDYIIEPGIGIEHCQSMNVYNSNWKDIDYVRSYAEIGNVNYQRLLYCIEYENYGLLVASTAIKNVSKVSHYTIKSGTLVITEKEFERAKQKLQYLDRFNETIEKTSIDGSKTVLKQMILLCYEMKDVDIERLYNKLNSNINLLSPYNNIESCAYSLELLYNRNARNYVYITTEYKKMARENTSRVHKVYKQKKREEEENDANRTN